MTGISFLGTGNYEEVTYTFGGKESKTKFFSKALYELFELDELKVVMTQEAYKKHNRELTEEIDFYRIDIPSGKSEEENWEMFTAIVDAVSEQTQLVVDVTHGFRSQPLLVLSALIFLRLHKQVQIEGIYYGAYDARDEYNKAPVFDLTPFLEIIDWTFAIRRFTEKGDAEELSEIMEDMHRRTWMEQKDYKARGLKNLGRHLDYLMKALSTVRPAEVKSEAYAISKILPDAQQDLEEMQQTKPLALIMGQIQNEVKRYQTGKNEELFSKQGFKIQIEMLRHYIQINQHQQALTLAVEMLYSLACIKHRKNPFDENDRDEISKRLLAIHRGDMVIYDVKAWEREINEILAMGTEYRNDINHAGIRKEPKPTSNIMKKTKEIVDQAIKFVEHNIIR